MNDRDRIRAETKRLRAEYGALFDEVAAILFDLDPIGINFETNTDEYEPEVRTILPRLRSCISVPDVRRAIHEEFVRWFDADSAGPESNYQEAAELVWAVWKHQRECGLTAR